MSSKSKKTRHSEEYSEDDNWMDEGVSRQQGQEKMKLLLLDILGKWHLLALGLVLGLLGGLYYFSKSPKLYQARSTLLLKQQTSSVMGKMERADDLDMRSLEAMNTVAQQIMRPELMQKIATRAEIRSLPDLMPTATDWRPDILKPFLTNSPKSYQQQSKAPPPPQVLAGMIASWTKVQVRTGTRLLDVIVTHRSPEVAKAVADAVGIEYQAELLGKRTSGRNTDLQILMEQSDAARKRLQTAQNAMAIYQRALDTLKDLEAREGAFEEIKRRYRHKHPAYVKSKDQVASSEKKFLTEFDAARSSAADQVYWEEKARELDEAGTAGRLQSARRLLLARASVLGSEIASQTTMFNALLNSIQESNISRQSEESEMEVSSFAQLPGGPISPIKSKILMTASMGGITAGLALALLLIRLDNRVHTVAQIERETGLSALAAIAHIGPAALAEAARENKVDVALAPTASKRWSPMLLFRPGAEETTYAEMFRVLRASVSLLGDENKRKVTLFSSALPGEGKTLVASNFALAAAQQGRRTLLIDLDLRKPAVHLLFGVRRDAHTHGSPELLSNQVNLETARYTDTGSPNLHLILGGSRAPNPGELLNGGVLRHILAKAREEYDCIVIDSAPLLAVPDTRIIARLVDNFCLVVRAEYCPKGAMHRAIGLLENDGNLPDGVVFNGYLESRRHIGQNFSYGNYQLSRYGRPYRYGHGSYGSSYGRDSEG